MTVFDKLLEAYNAHPGAFFILWYLVSTGISFMPAPTTSGPGYTWLYNFLHGIVAGNLGKVLNLKAPVANALILLLLLPLLILPACHGYMIHPGAPDMNSSEAYDSLLAAKAVIDGAKMSLQAGTLDSRFKPFINDAIASYNLAVTALNGYSNAMKANQPGDIYWQNLTSDLTALNNKILTLKGVVQ